MLNFRFMFGALIGAGMMYLLDPRMGRRRQALLRDQMVKLMNRASRRAENMMNYATDRAQGMAAEAARPLTGPVSDETLVARVRSDMGRFVSHPRAIEVEVQGGVVTLRGNILASEVQPFVAHVRKTHGVRQVNNELQVRENATNIPDLQGGRTRSEFR